MSIVTTYNYNASFKFKTTLQQSQASQINPLTQAQIQDALHTSLANVAAQQYAAAFAAKAPSHWLRVNGSTVTITDFAQRQGQGVIFYDIAGTCVTNIDTDIANARTELSPQNWWTIFLGVVGVIALIVVGLGTLGLIFLAIIAFVAVAESLANTTTGDLIAIGQNLGAMIVVVGVLVVAALGIYALFFTKGGQKVTSKGLEYGEKATRKGYQLARATYRQARSARSR